ncbi:3-deoxy-7-phosphoheptulonate synthase / chorismate mutase [Thermoflexales bacterium]|nr:3-deoxy-7-phosphoheptulonate synthase / chorismate mutase [Thermoflexales bacterium]
MSRSLQQLSELRQQIDRIDLDLLRLANSRGSLALEIQQLKHERGLPAYAPERESQILEQLMTANAGPLSDDAVEDIFHRLFQHSRFSLKPSNSMATEYQGESKVVSIGSIEIGNGQAVFMGGPCAVESEEQVEQTAQWLSQLGVSILRGGAFKPRTSPHSFQGLGRDGLDMLVRAARRYGLATVSEIMDPRDLDYFIERVDILQIGARNMQNTPLLREVGRSGKPILLKRGFMSTIEELLLAAEYILLEGNPQIVVCERGIRTFETLTRNTLDLACVALVKRLRAFPVIVDLSHSLGRTDIMLPIARAALACGCDGLMIEVHPNPAKARSDGQQTLSFSEMADLISGLQPLLEFLKREKSPSVWNLAEESFA